ncbi:hypothetical protein G3N95_37010 [Paraburkholderia sp. Tr-20389]|nr:hypothetical protein [Paraburkholderia sp. Tr-20389]
MNGRQLFALSKRVTDEISGVSERIAKIENQPGPVSPDGRKRDKDAKPAPLDGGGQRATNIAKGVADTDGVNVKQLNDVVANGVKNGVQQANAYTDLQVNSVRADMEHDRKDAQGGSASAIAIANLPQAYAGESMVSLAGGAFDGQSAVALGVSTSTQNWTVKASFTTNTRGSYGGGAGVGYRF